MGTKPNKAGQHVGLEVNSSEGDQYTASYCGEFLKYDEHGKGRADWANGGYQEGDFVNGQMKTGFRSIFLTDGESKVSQTLSFH